MDEVCLGDDEVNKFIDKYGGDVGSLMREGVGSLDLDFWRDLVQVGFLIIPDHQLLYSDPKDPSRTGFFHFSPELIEQAISEGGFSYQTFRQLYSQFLSRAGQIDEGHVDIIVGVRKINGIDCIILANSSAVRNGPPLAIPWNLFKNYLALDWSLPVITDIGQLPNEEQMQQIREKGSLDIGEANFFYGSYDIYYPKDRQRELDEILEKHHLI